MRISAFPAAFAIGVVAVIATTAATSATSATAVSRVITVSGTGMDHLTKAVIHSKKPTATGSVQHSTEVIDLQGDLVGTVLYQVTTAIDTVHARLVNTGEQVFSGTIAGSAPVMIHDDRFRFEVNLATGSETGEVHLTDHIAGPKVRCTLHVTGTGMKEGNPTFRYAGKCVFAGQ